MSLLCEFVSSKLEWEACLIDLPDRCVTCESVSSEHELKACRPGEGVLARRCVMCSGDCSLGGAWGAQATTCSHIEVTDNSPAVGVKPTSFNIVISA